ncbi:hypothetical protein [Alteromonas lipolytica]|uniref:Lipoprotein n=1 Tax=Alteromonas lipolytica TaxID=1856405 RepID=A0A1E8F8X9_9ALTE|nr:hypothetical protein [Alteromonas lipolytica]OFI32372.1 hypothetical protein BFC17_07260 [Alteromonas lipolytica]GGF86519.1 hypothetical protein GCM10011338_43660 [Alteromonas lipolytica]
MRLPFTGLPALGLLLLTACSEAQLPTIGRTLGDVPMSRLISFDSQQKCYRFLKSVAFEAPFADGMAYQQSTCLAKDIKVGRKTMEEVSQLHVSLTSDGEYYIVKGGY